ncbi:MAG TPA: fumarylacetoacetate hydrolase family protein [Actinomycetota bacterium]|nr:fumarylacetoacetate hydrolase family protein [Actinomycetota bacterium]
MPEAVFRVRIPHGGERLAVGAVDDGPRAMLDAGITLDRLLSAGGPSLADALSMGDDVVPGGARVLAPIGSQEIWAAGVTYLRSRDARVEEAVEASVYDRVYEAERPELFFKSPGWRARGPGEAIGIRSDSSWDVPEPELTLVVDAGLRIVGYTIGNDASSRSIEGDNPLYLSQAKIYEGSTGLGPAIVPATEVDPPFGIAIRISRGGETVYDAATSSGEMARSFEELVAYLGRALRFPLGVFLMTGTGLVPGAGFTLSPDDVVTISVDGLGELRNPVERVGAAAPA